MLFVTTGATSVK